MMTGRVSAIGQQGTKTVPGQGEHVALVSYGNRMPDASGHADFAAAGADCKTRGKKQ